MQIEGRLFWRLSGRAGMYDSRAVLAEIAAEIPLFAAAGGGELGPTGVDLKQNLLASAPSTLGDA